jgi:limonene-1,2-epoxide hydrolase
MVDHVKYRCRVDYSSPATDDHVAAAVEHYLAERVRIETEDGDWGDLADCFSEDAVWVDCAWGRVEGREHIRAFLREAMVGVDFENPTDFWAADGPRVLIKWRQVLPTPKPDGGRWQQSAVSTLLYAGDGLFRYEEDLLNVVHCVEDIVASGWAGGPGFQAPPERVDRDFDPTPRGA